MPFDDESLRQLFRLLEARPEARAELRRLVGGDGVEQALRDLARAQVGTEARLATLAERMDQLAQAQALTEARLAALTERVDRLAERVDALAEAQARTEERLAALTERVDRLAERVDALTARVDALAEAQARTEEQLRQLASEVRELVAWQKGEAGRREGERYEQHIRRRALSLFQGGSGGLPTEPRVQERLETLLAEILATEGLDERHDPSLADLIWWKNGSYAVVEAALFVEWDDVTRAHARAMTLERAGKGKGVDEVLAVVLGRGWSSPAVRREAEQLGVAWWVGDDLAPRLIEYRRRTPAR